MEPLTNLGRRRFLGQSIAGAAWMTAVGQMLAEAAAPPKRCRHARSIIMLWMGGGPSQLETFDPHPGKLIGGETRAIPTSVKGVQFADNLPLLAEQMGSLAVIRSMVSKEGDHERGTYTMKTGFRPDPTVVHPSIGAVFCHRRPEDESDVPRHVTILPDQWSPRGGYLGDQFDAFRIPDPSQRVPDTASYLPSSRDEKRLASLDVVEKAFARGREKRVEATLHRDTVARARKMMSAEQLAAFDVSKEPIAVRRAYGDSPFGRGCLAARRLTEAGVRCIEVNLGGWDTHINNHKLTKSKTDILDPAFSALLQDLKKRGTLDDTLVVWAGEFGRTPKINPAGGRDHWPTGFSVVLAGGGIRGGTVLGETDPTGKESKPTNPVTVGDLFATILTTVGITPEQINQTKIGRTIPNAEGKPIRSLLTS